MTTFTKLELELVAVALRARPELLESFDSWLLTERAADYRALLARLGCEGGGV